MASSRDTRFEGRVLLCTGAASGIGREVCRLFAAGGGQVAALDRDERGAKAVAAEHGDGLGVAVDVSDEAAVIKAVKSVVAAFGRLDAVYNGAGFHTPQTVEATPVSELMRFMAVHVGGSLAVSREALPALRASGNGTIVNTASVVAKRARPNAGLYGASKAAVIAMTRQMALEWAPLVRVNSVSPGPTLTGMTMPGYARLGEGDIARGAESSAQEVMLKRVAEPHELAAAICFLLSDESTFITAEDLVVDGGMTSF